MSQTQFKCFGGDQMKRLISLLGIGLLAVGGYSFEANRFKYIPEDSPMLVYNFNNFYLLVWDRNENSMLEIDEVFFDVNKDGIPDISWKEIQDAYLKSEFNQEEFSLGDRE